MLVREFLLLPRTDFPCCLAILSHCYTQLLGICETKQLISEYSQLELLASCIPWSHISERHILMATQFHPLSHTHLFFHTGLGDNFFIIPMGWFFLKRLSEKERKYVADHCPLLQLFSELQLIRILYCLSGLSQMWL